MRGPMTFRSRTVATCAPFLSVLCSLPALAQTEKDPFAEEPTPHAGKLAPDGSVQPAAPAPAPAPAPASEDAGLVERLPGSAYPEWTTRGIEGGSLWFSGNMHGMPWPYYQRTGIGVSGYAWVDTGYETVQRGNVAEPDIKYLVS